MPKTKHRIIRRVGMAALALLMAVAVSLPNYARAIDAERIQSDSLRELYETYLAEMGAQEAHAVVPALALPVALSSAGVTAEAATAAFAAMCTAVAGVSLVQSWDDLDLADKQVYGDKNTYLQALLFGGAISQGLWTWDQNGSEPPEPNGDKGNKFNAAILALCTGAGALAVKDLADAAGYLIDFVTSPFGEDENGFPTGLGAVTSNKVVNINGLSLPLPSITFVDSMDGYAPNYVGTNVFLGDALSWLTYTPTFQPTGPMLGDAQFVLKQDGTLSCGSGNVMLSTVSALYKYKDQWNKEKIQNTNLNGDVVYSYLVANGMVKVPKSNIELIYYNGVSWVSLILYDATTKTWNSDSVVDLTNFLFSAANAPSASSEVLQQVAQAGVGSEAANQIVNNYVTNNIANSEKVVTVPSDLIDTGDYNKVVTDPAPGPDPGPGPGTDETTREKAEKFLKLPVQQLFPFCLVYDIQLLIEHVAGSGVATLADDSLVFEFDISFGYFDAPLVIDLTDYRDMQGSFHMVFDVLLVVGLLYFSISLFLKARSD